MAFISCAFIIYVKPLPLLTCITTITLLVTSIYITLFQPYSWRTGIGEGVSSKDDKLNSTVRMSMVDTCNGAGLCGNLLSFNISRDVMVFLHMQKTGGTSFEQNLVKNLVLERECKKTKAFSKTRFECKRPPNSSEFWLYSRYSTGWVCGLHADWTTMSTCIPNVLRTEHMKNRQLFFISFLRNPVRRFLSEFKHVQRGATWKRSRNACTKLNRASNYCYSGLHWHGVTLSEFLNCSQNLAFNRQTRMLANLNEVGCYNASSSVSEIREYEKRLLTSAKATLRSLSYFGLVEYQKESQYLFERTFGLKFKNDFRQISDNDTWSGKILKTVPAKLLLRIQKANRLDSQLYRYAKTLFFDRLRKATRTVHTA